MTETVRRRSSGTEQHMLLDLSVSNVAVQNCGCHEKDEDKEKHQKKAIIKLIIAVGLGMTFMTGEAVGGYIANSLAVMTDALHMLTDVISLAISLFAIWLGRQKPSKYMTFGWKRAEVLGDFLSVLMIYGISGVLIYEATKRVRNPDSYELDPDIMLIVSCGGVFMNVIMLCVLHQGGGHGHSHGGLSHSKTKKNKKELSNAINETVDCDGKGKGKKKKLMRDNINVTAASIHVIGDIFQTIGVLITSYIIWFRRDWKIADPICTYIFGILIIFTTCRIMLDILRILMEGVPRGIDIKELKGKLLSLPGVEMVHSLCVWSINVEHIAVAAHIVLKKDSQVEADDLLKEAVSLMKEEYGASYTALQLEGYQQTMSTCKECCCKK